MGKSNAALAQVPVKVGTHEGVISRRNDGKSSKFYFRYYLTSEKRYYRKSLDTEDVLEAKKRATDALIEILGKINTGQRVISISLGDLRRKYLFHLQNGKLAERTKELNRYRVERGIRFLATKRISLDTRVSTIDGEVFKEYEVFRRAEIAEKNKTAKKQIKLRNDVIRDELLSIRKMFKFAKEEKLCSDKQIPFWRIVVEREGAKRHRMNIHDYRTFIHTMRSWVNEDASDKERYKRLMVQHSVLTMAACGLRSGEMFALRNRDVQIHEERKECVINIESGTSKKRRGRKITIHATAGGRPNGTEINYLIRWMNRYQRHKDPDDLVFTNFDNQTLRRGARKKVKRDDDARTVFYKTYESLRSRLNEVGIGWFDPYHARHWFATNKLYAGQPIHLVANVLGSSTRELESTYSHVITEIASRKFNKTEVHYGEDGSIEVTEKSKRKKAKS